MCGAKHRHGVNSIKGMKGTHVRVSIVVGDRHPVVARKFIEVYAKTART